MTKYGDIKSDIDMPAGASLRRNATDTEFEAVVLTPGGATAWGDITGTLASQTDLNGALSGKETANVNIQAHVTSAHAPSTAQKNSDIIKSEIEAKLTGEISTHTHAGGSDLELIVSATQDTANATTTLADATGLIIPVLINSTYLIDGFILWNTSAVTVGIKLSATAPASPTIFAGHFITDSSNGTPDSSSFNANDVTVTTSASSFTTYNIAALHCILKTGGTPGNFQIRFAAETTGTCTVKSGSILRYRKIA